ncbi:MAG: hypothetical protein KDJ35_09260 [Alphaproteobacteria bacterium]|nr:hypothetical protein [Alphaproteobacteria bacterium]
MDSGFGRGGGDGRRGEEYVSASIHQFKNNISRYIRALEDGRHRAVIVRRNDRPVGLFVPYKSAEE